MPGSPLQACPSSCARRPSPGDPVRSVSGQSTPCQWRANHQDPVTTYHQMGGEAGGIAPSRRTTWHLRTSRLTGPGSPTRRPRGRIPSHLRQRRPDLPLPRRHGHRPSMTAWNIAAVVHSTDHEAAVQNYELLHHGSPHMSGLHACPARLGPALNERGYYVGLSWPTKTRCRAGSCSARLPEGCHEITDQSKVIKCKPSTLTSKSRSKNRA
jgi:hypothetical protein